MLRTGSMTPDDWEHFFIEAGISTASAKTHATKFVDEKLTIESLQMLDCSMLKELGVTLMGKALCILKQAKEAAAQSTRIQALTAKPPNLNIEMTPQQFRKFQIDWVKLNTLLSSFGESNNVALISPDAILAAGCNDLQQKIAR